MKGKNRAPTIKKNKPIPNTKTSMERKPSSQIKNRHCLGANDQSVSMGQVLSELLRMIEQIDKECESR